MFGKRRLIYVLLVLAGGLLLWTRQTYYADRWRRVENEEAGFTLLYPASWFNVGPSKLPTRKYIELCVMDFPVIDTIELRVYSAHKEAEGTKYYPSFGVWLAKKNNKNIRILSQKEITIGRGDYQGEEFLYEDKTHRGRIVNLEHRGKIYAIEINAVQGKWDKANAVFEDILKTFEFLE